MMANIHIKLPDDLALMLSKLGEQTDEIVPKVLKAGGEVVLEKVRSNLAAVVGVGTKLPSRSTGTLQSALGLTNADCDNNGNWDIKVGFSDSRPDGESNAKIASILEYGKVGQPPKPFMTPAKSQTKNAALDAMKAAFEQEIKPK